MLCVQGTTGLAFTKKVFICVLGSKPDTGLTHVQTCCSVPTAALYFGSNQPSLFRTVPLLSALLLEAVICARSKLLIRCCVQ